MKYSRQQCVVCFRWIAVYPRGFARHSNSDYPPYSGERRKTCVGSGVPPGKLRVSGLKSVLYG